MEPENINQSQSNPISLDESQVKESTNRMASGEPTTTDIDANLYQAKVSGDEAIGGLASTPEQNVTQEIERVVGVAGAQKEPAQVTDKLKRRDEKRWELDPKSSEDYQEHGL
ncbi:MAG: DUF6335 family protein [Coleofasciculus sp. G1-WW12-02]|uniref:DUF6335 family protein n=1 Tax=Coleofasciculus sp. G1-WW12-02 TaxID=3068483 RepID=UPI0032FDF0ED